MLKNILARFLQTANTDTQQEKLENLTKQEQARKYIERLSAHRKRPYNPLNASLVDVDVIESNMLLLIVRIDHYADTLNNGHTLTHSQVYIEPMAMSFDKFFTDTDGNYIPSETTWSFIRSCKDLFAVLDEMKRLGDKDYSYTDRLLRKCFTSIISVCKAMEATGK